MKKIIIGLIVFSLCTSFLLGLCFDSMVDEEKFTTIKYSNTFFIFDLNEQFFYETYGGDLNEIRDFKTRGIS